MVGDTPDDLVAGNIALPMSKSATVVNTTYMPELTPADVGLPFDPSVHHFTVKPCYVYTEWAFHAGDVFMWRLSEDEKIPIIAPMAGKIINASWVNSNTGYEVNVATDYSHTNDTGTGRVYYDLVHLAELEPGISDGKFFHKGKAIGYLTKAVTDPSGKSILDIALRNRSDKQANASLPGWKQSRGHQFFSFLYFVSDDLSALSSNMYNNVPTCEGHPYPK
jgi:hypothetical protein